MIKILGTGWVKKGKCGLRRKGLIYKYTNLRSLYLSLREKGIFRFPVDNFARFDPASKIVSIAVGLALYDAGIFYLKGNKQNIGILATNKNGSLDAQLVYFKDYIDNGRTLGRGNLFIYTLSSSPLAEAAIHFGLTGPFSYINFSDSRQNSKLMEYAEAMIKGGEAKMMLVLESTNKETVCFAIGKT